MQTPPALELRPHADGDPIGSSSMENPPGRWLPLDRRRNAYFDREGDRL